MAVQLESIQFSQLNGNGALSLRHNYQQSLVVPEWTPTASNPVLYAFTAFSTEKPNVVLTLTADNTIPRAWIRSSGGGKLGIVQATPVDFIQGQAVVTVKVSGFSYNAVAIDTVTWIWEYSVDGVTWSSLGRSEHRVYLAVATPSTPWQPRGNSQSKQISWADLLEVACHWAQGAHTTEEVVAMVTAAVNSQLGFQYDTKSGCSNYSDNLNVNISKLLMFINSNNGPRVVNCSDCAAIVSTVANALGADIDAIVMSSKQFFNGQLGHFACNKIQAIGFTGDWSYPFANAQGTHGGFSYHEVACDQRANSPAIFDACLQLDAGSNPWDWTSASVTHVPTLPVAMPFSASGTLPIAVPFNSKTYRERLATNTAQGIGNCTFLGCWPSLDGGRRKVI